MNTHDIELPPLPVGTTSPMIYGAYYCASNMQDYARTAIEADRQRGTAKQRYDAAMNGCNETDPIERLRFYCSLAMSGQDWIDVEPFFDALIADRKRRGEPVAWLYEDELPDNYPYEAMFPYSKVDGVRMFPVNAPQPTEPSADAMTATEI